MRRGGYDGAGETIVNPDLPPDQTDEAAGWAGRAFLWVALALAVVYLPMFFGRIVFFRDIAHWIFPARIFVRDSLLRGELPAWNPLQGLGFAAFSNPLTACSILPTGCSCWWAAIGSAQ